MSLTENGGGVSVSMPVAPIGYGNGYGGGYPVTSYPVAYPVPAYGNFGGGFGDGFGGDWSWLIILFLFAMFGGGFGNGFGGFGGFGGMMGADMFNMFPWLLASDNNTNSVVSNGFDHAATQSTLSSINSAVTSGFGDVQTALCNGFGNVQNSLCSGFAGVNATVNNAQNSLAQQLYTNQISDLERSFAAQTASTQGMNAIQSQLAQCCCDNRAATADLKYTVATENCADRAALSDGVRDIIASNTAQTQAILDKLCALELDGVKNQLAQAQRENTALQNAINMANMQASQTAQTAQILAGQAAEIDGVYNRLKNCPVPSMPVYGNTPIFNCQSGGCGCGCGVT